MDKLLYKENEEVREITKNEYLKAIGKELEIKPTEVDGDDVPVEMILNHAWKVNEKGVEIEPSLQKAWPQLFARVEADFKASKEIQEGAKKDAADEKKKKEEEKEALKKAEEEKEKLIIAKQEELAPAIKAGADTAAGEFKAQLKSLGESLPEGLKLVSAGDGEGFTLIADENVSDEVLTQGMGYVIQSALNNEFMGGVFQFAIGDLTNALTGRGIYRTQKEAGEHVGKLLANAGKRMVPSQISQYAKMAERVPAEKRNPRVQPTAYLEVANIPLAKKGEKESDADFKARLDKINTEKEAVLNKLASGEYTDRKDVVEKVKEIKLDNGLIKAPEAGFNLTEAYRTYFFLKTTMEHFMDIHVEGVAQFKQGDKVYNLTKEEVQEQLDAIESQLRNHNFTNKKAKLDFKDIVNGKKEITTKGGAVDAKGKKIDRVDVVEVFPEPFWNVEQAEAAEAEAAATPAEETPKEEAKEQAEATA